jgi:galactosylgalactosylxylosylprotein 3-beta-glucuronosyltransferase 2
MRFTKRVSVWPVAFVGEIKYEKPIIKNGKVTDWFVTWGDKRPYPIDMAGFAVNLNLLLSHPSARFSQFVARGMQESHFLKNLIRNQRDLEPKADNCTKVIIFQFNINSIRILIYILFKIRFMFGILIHVMFYLVVKK